MFEYARKMKKMKRFDAAFRSLNNLSSFDAEYLNGVIKDDMASNITKKKCRLLLYLRDIASGGIPWKKKTEFIKDIEKRSGLTWKTICGCIESYYDGGIGAVLADRKAGFVALELSADQVNTLKKIVASTEYNKHERGRARALLVAGRAWRNGFQYVHFVDAARVGGVCPAVLSGVTEKFVEYGMDCVFMRVDRFDSKQREKLSDFLVKAVASDPPDGRYSWTLKLLAEEATKRGLNLFGRKLFISQVKTILDKHGIRIRHGDKPAGRIYSYIERIGEMPKHEVDLLSGVSPSRKYVKRAKLILSTALAVCRAGKSRDDCVKEVMGLALKNKNGRAFVEKVLSDYSEHGLGVALFRKKKRFKYEQVDLLEKDRKLLDGVLKDRDKYPRWLIARVATLIGLDENIRLGITPDSIDALSKELEFSPSGIEKTVKRYYKDGIKSVLKGFGKRRNYFELLSATGT